MHLIVNHVAQLQEVSHTHRSRLVETLTSTTIIQVRLTVARNTSFVCPFVQIIQSRTIEDRSSELNVQLTSGPTQHGLENLSQVHTRRHTQRVQADIHRSTVFQERHILLTNDL